MNKINYRFFFGVYIVLHILLALIVFNLDEKMNTEGINFKFRLDYIAHILAFMPWMVWGHVMKFKKTKWLVFGILFAIIMEGLHYFVPYRVFNIVDLLSNIVGVVLGFGLLNLWLYIVHPKKR
jgi:glycopeptide antibiotics resistance protein